ncbi:DnaA N-terminal domain-containing protein [Sporomusa acidovorans]|uniref:Chromosomal replication initiator protein DnaA n=1 Tax=Sporomusa acidovorans (strain ATCC 49682 / DSM 3132 / Mol) TaxID=1123286 RepID=A0ABZ3J519_SPOA4|nr:DnaA N-terminal domain-containing protein [Sporomusa acidovorans]OZC23140.1 chromosomal replication initiator protein DnaA [Sporomusa acidovorans DSM 3132]SDF06539.1 DnaA N-terminal domain-containing protein [Sporomusa acidovorans]
MIQSELAILWNQILLDLRREIMKPLFDTWIANLVPIEVNKQEFIIGTPKQFIKEWMEERYTELLRDLVKRHIGRDIDIVYVNLDLPLSVSKVKKPRSLTPIEKLLQDFQGLTLEKQEQAIKFVESLQAME